MRFFTPEEKYEWQNILKLGPRSFICGFCNVSVAPETGIFAVERSTNANRAIYICHNCENPTYFNESRLQFPAPMYGSPIMHLNDDLIAKLYQEARACTSATAYTSAVMACRKLLMHIAVEKGAEEGLKFQQYVNYLVEKNYVPQGGKEWVEHIKDKGNDANHEIELMTQSDAEEVINFTEMLLKFIYEFPEKVKLSKTRDVKV